MSDIPPRKLTASETSILSPLLRGVIDPRQVNVKTPATMPENVDAYVSGLSPNTININKQRPVSEPAYLNPLLAHELTHTLQFKYNIPRKWEFLSPTYEFGSGRALQQKGTRLKDLSSEQQANLTETFFNDLDLRNFLQFQIKNLTQDNDPRFTAFLPDLHLQLDAMQADLQSLAPYLQGIKNAAITAQETRNLWMQKYGGYNPLYGLVKNLLPQ